MIGDKRLLIVDDDVGLSMQLKWHFAESDYSVLTAHNRAAAIDMIRQYRPAVVIQDLMLPPDEETPAEGFQTMEAIRRIHGDTRVVVVTAMDCNQALKAVSLGAYDFFSKPVDLDVLDHVVDRAFQMWELEQRLEGVEQPVATNVHGFITANPNMLKICARIDRLAETNVTCLINGESGTGKEVLARAMHAMSSRRKEPFVAINCAAIPEGLIESELFGHEKGAFTGADTKRIGLVEAANRGTLFLDEIGDMPLHAQVKMLRFIQEKTVGYVGGRKEVPVDVRIICATNRDLRQMVAEGRFREDLFYRVAEIEVPVLPLRDRGEDRLVLAQHFLKQFSRELKRGKLRFDEQAISAIDSYRWPGNVRELISAVRKGIVLAEGKTVTADLMGLAAPVESGLNLRDVREAAEREAVVKSLAVAGGKIARAARLLGVSRPTFYSLLKRHCIDCEDVNPDEAATTSR